MLTGGESFIYIPQPGEHHSPLGKVCAPSACVELVGLPLPPGEQFERADGTMMSFGEDELMRISYHKAFEQAWHSIT